MTNKALKFYTEHLNKFNHILTGSLAIRMQNAEFREPNDVDIYVENLMFVQKYLETIKKESEFIIEYEAHEYYNELIMIQLKFKDDSKIDILQGTPNNILLIKIIIPLLLRRN